MSRFLQGHCAVGEGEVRQTPVRSLVEVSSLDLSFLRFFIFKLEGAADCLTSARCAESTLHVLTRGDDALTVEIFTAAWCDVTASLPHIPRLHDVPENTDVNACWSPSRRVFQGRDPRHEQDLRQRRLHHHEEGHLRDAGQTQLTAHSFKKYLSSLDRWNEENLNMWPFLPEKWVELRYPWLHLSSLLKVDV